MRSIFFSSFEYLSLALALTVIHGPKDLHEALITDLLKPHRHDPRVRPVENPAEIVNVTIGLSLQMIENLVCNTSVPELHITAEFSYALANISKLSPKIPPKSSTYYASQFSH